MQVILLLQAVPKEEGGATKVLSGSLGSLPFTQTMHPSGNLVYKHKTIEFDVAEEQSTTKYIQFKLTVQTQKSRKLILHRLKSQATFSNTSQTEWHEPFDFPTRFFSFPV